MTKCLLETPRRPSTACIFPSLLLVGLIDDNRRSSGQHLRQHQYPWPLYRLYMLDRVDIISFRLQDVSYLYIWSKGFPTWEYLIFVTAQEPHLVIPLLWSVYFIIVGKTSNVLECLNLVKHVDEVHVELSNSGVVLEVCARICLWLEDARIPKEWRCCAWIWYVMLMGGFLHEPPTECTYKTRRRVFYSTLDAKPRDCDRVWLSISWFQI